MGIGHAEGVLSLLDTPYLVQEWDLPAQVVLITGDGHTWIGLDYRACGPRGEPSITWFDAEMETELALAPDFRSFVEALRPVSGVCPGGAFGCGMPPSGRGWAGDL